MLKFNRWMWDIETVNKVVFAAEADDIDPDNQREGAEFDEDDEQEE
jgi:hypothetical protein